MTLSLFSGLAWLILVTLGGIIGACGKSNVIYLSELTQNERVFRKPLALRVGAGVLSLSMLELPLFFTTSGWALFVLSLALCVYIGWLLLLVAGPDELRLNLLSHTFQRVRGWRFFTSTWSGALADLRCIYMTELSSPPSNTAYSVGVRGGRIGGQMKLGNFTSLAPAERFANELVCLTNLPLISSVNPVRHTLRSTGKGQSSRNRT